MIVKVKEVAIRHNGKRYGAGEEFSIESELYDRIKGDVTVIDANDQPKPFDKMTIAELKDYAAENGIDLGEASKKEEILQFILAASKE